MSQNGLYPQAMAIWLGKIRCYMNLHISETTGLLDILCSNKPTGLSLSWPGRHIGQRFKSHPWRLLVDISQHLPWLFFPMKMMRIVSWGSWGGKKNPIPAMEEQPQAVEAVDSEEHNGPSYGSLRCQGALLQGIFWMMNVYQDITGRFELPWCWKMEGRPCETPCETRMDTNWYLK